jgi:hypothetical protein
MFNNKIVKNIFLLEMCHQKMLAFSVESTSWTAYNFSRKVGVPSFRKVIVSALHVFAQGNRMKIVSNMFVGVTIRVE